jgi:hypothetical protein
MQNHSNWQFILKNGARRADGARTVSPGTEVASKTEEASRTDNSSYPLKDNLNGGSLGISISPLMNGLQDLLSKKETSSD